MRLDEQQQNDRAQKGAEYYLAQLALFNAHLPAFLEVDIDNKETAKSVDEAGKELTEALKVKITCLRTVKEKGYSVQAVQKAKVDALMSGEKSEKRKSKRETKQRDTRPTQTGTNPELLILLRQWRAAKAKEEGIPAFHVLHQSVLTALATDAPRTPSQLLAVKGMGPKTLEKYGNEILELILQSLP